MIHGWRYALAPNFLVVVPMLELIAVAWLRDELSWTLASFASWVG